MKTRNKLATLKVFLCGAGDVTKDMNEVISVTHDVNGSLSSYVGHSLLTDYWKHQGGPEGQTAIFEELKSSDLVIFFFYKKLGRLAELEFQKLIDHLAPYEVTQHSLEGLTADEVPEKALLRLEGLRGRRFSSREGFLATLRNVVGSHYYRRFRLKILSHSQEFSEETKPKLRVCFKHVPPEYEIHFGAEYTRIKNFKEKLNFIGPYGLLYHVYRNDEAFAEPFASNDQHPKIEVLSFQILSQFLVKSAGLIPNIITDRVHVSAKGLITKDMIIKHWEERAKRHGLGPVTSGRYPPERVPGASDNLVSFLLEKASGYIKGLSVIELGSGIGRFTSQLLRISKRLAAVDMCPSMKEKLADALGEDWSRIRYTESFVEDLPADDSIYDCAFSCLLFIHIVDESRLNKAISNLKRLANTAVICEHVDISMQSKASNFTRIWPVEKYLELFSDDFELCEEYDYNYLGDKLKLLIFRRISIDGDFGSVESWLPSSVKARESEDLAESWKRWYHLFDFAGTTLPYEHLLGSHSSGAYEFSVEQLEIRSLGETPYALPEALKARQSSLVRAAKTDILKTGYDPKDVDKVRIEKLNLAEIDPVDALPRKLQLTIRPMRYFDYLVVKKALSDPQENFREAATAFHPLALGHIGELATSNIGGCGVFVITRDGFLILSHREQVAEYPDTISYSASGSMSWTIPGTDDFESNPFITILREAHEELGIRIKPHDLILFAIGLDVRAFFIQFTFYAQVQLSAREVLTRWSTATARYEQEPFAVPLEPELLARLAVRYSMEPAAKATLMQLCCKRFGRNTFSRYLQTAKALEEPKQISEPRE